MSGQIFYQLKSGAGMQLICFPYLGGYANSFQHLANQITGDMDIWSSNAPGHGSEQSTPLQSIQSLVDLYYQHLKAIVRPNYIFYGHSMGAVVAFFLANKIVSSIEYPVKPTAIILSGSNPPSFYQNLNCAALSDKEVIDRIISYGGISDLILKEQSLLEYFLPVYRADFKVLESSADCEYERLDIPAYLLQGEKDSIVSLEQAISWTRYFVDEINLIMIENGRHMFIEEQATLVAKQLESICCDIS
jgi:external thioesterase TEII